MNDFETRPERVITISKRKLAVIVVILIILLIIGGFFWYTNFAGRGYDTYDTMEESVSVPSVGFGGGGDGPLSVTSGKAITEDYYFPEPHYRERPDITDTREYIKTDYSANIETRDVPEVVEGVEDAVESVDGRVDNRSSSHKYGYVSFVIPKSELDEFREEIGELASEKLIFETISSQNLLSQKQDIEMRTEDVVKSLEELEKEKEELDDAHASRLSSLQSQVSELERQIDIVDIAIGALDEDEEEKIIELQAQKSSLEQRVAILRSQQTKENRNYTEENNYLLQLIAAAGGNLERLADEDTDFMNNIETVEGRVNVRWINLWTMGNRFSPSPMWLNTAVVVILIIWYLKRRRVIPRIQVV